MRIYKLETNSYLGSCLYDRLEDLLEEIKIMIDEDDGVSITITSLEMSKAKYERLPEHSGW